MLADRHGAEATKLPPTATPRTRPWQSHMPSTPCTSAFVARWPAQLPLVAAPALHTAASVEGPAAEGCEVPASFANHRGHDLACSCLPARLSRDTQRVSQGLELGHGEQHGKGPLRKTCSRCGIHFFRFGPLGFFSGFLRLHEKGLVGWQAISGAQAFSGVAGYCPQAHAANARCAAPHEVQAPVLPQHTPASGSWRSELGLSGCGQQA